MKWLKRILHLFTMCDADLLTEAEGSDMLECSCGRLVTPAEAFYLTNRGRG